MKNTTLVIIALVAIAMVVFIIPKQVSAQDLGDIDLPSMPTMDKPISDMTIPELQAKIAEIITVIQQLQALIAQLQGGGIPGVPSGFSFEHNLKYGQSNQEVKYVQIFLNADPDTQVSSTGPGFPGTRCYG